MTEVFQSIRTLKPLVVEPGCHQSREFDKDEDEFNRDVFWDLIEDIFKLSSFAENLPGSVPSPDHENNGKTSLPICRLSRPGIVEHLPCREMELKEAQNHVGGLIEILCLSPDSIAKNLPSWVKCETLSRIKALADKCVVIVNDNGISAGFESNHLASVLTKRDIYGPVVVCHRDYFDV